MREEDEERRAEGGIDSRDSRVEGKRDLDFYLFVLEWIVMSPSAQLSLARLAAILVFTY